MFLVLVEGRGQICLESFLCICAKLFETWQNHWWQQPQPKMGNETLFGSGEKFPAWGIVHTGCGSRFACRFCNIQNLRCCLQTVWTLLFARMCRSIISMLPSARCSASCVDGAQNGSDGGVSPPTLFGWGCGPAVGFYHPLHFRWRWPHIGSWTRPTPMVWTFNILWCRILDPQPDSSPKPGGGWVTGLQFTRIQPWKWTVPLHVTGHSIPCVWPRGDRPILRAAGRTGSRV